MKLKNILLTSAGLSNEESDFLLKIFNKIIPGQTLNEERQLVILRILSKVSGISIEGEKKLNENQINEFKAKIKDAQFEKKIINQYKKETKNVDYHTVSDSGSSLFSESNTEEKDFSKKYNSITEDSAPNTDYKNNNYLENENKVPKSTYKNERNNVTSNNSTIYLQKQNDIILSNNGQIKNPKNIYNPNIEAESKVSIESKCPRKNIKKFYYQIHQENLSSIYDSALITPTKYDSHRTQIDIQDKYPSYLLLSDIEIIYNDNTSKHLMLELYLNEYETPIPLNSSGIFLYDKALPISRISKIIYSDTQYFDKLFQLVKADGTSFIPNTIASHNPNINRSSLQFDSNYTECNIDFTDKLRVFDKRLGALAFMKNANLYYGDFSNYSDNYFFVLNEFDPKFLDNQNHKIEDDIKTTFKKAFNLESNEDKKNDIYSDKIINKDYLENKLKANDSKSFQLLPKGPFSINKNEYLEAINKYFKGWFYVAYLAIYGDRSAASTASIQLKNGFANEVKNREKADTLLALLGAYYGYKAIRPHDQININTTDLLSNEIDINTNIKFKMNSQLDYLTVETVYQKTFNNQVADYDFIKSFAPHYTANPQLLELYNKFSKNKFYKCDIQPVYDVQYIRIIRKDKKEFILEKLKNNYGQKINANVPFFSWIYNFFFEKGIIRISADGIYVLKNDIFEELNKCDEKFIQELDIIKFDKLIDFDINN